MACRLFGTKPLSGPMLASCYLEHWEQVIVKYDSKYKNRQLGKGIWKYHLLNDGHFVLASIS